ncbi:MAG: 16S rRNA (guanine(527)-N(7))-methyltransferase RsmG [Clostridium sp.]
MQYYDLLKLAFNDAGLEFTDEKYNQFMKYKDMIKEWNQKINLTAITEDEEIIKKHFIDSIKVFKYKNFINGKTILDVGTGGGFPGIPIKIANPNCKIVLLDSLNKRIIFLNEVIKELGLQNISAIHGRAEEYANQSQYREQFDIVVSRAVANMCVLSEFCIPYVKPNGCFIALKGPAVEEELNDARNAIGILGGKLTEVQNVNIEGSELNHNLVVVKKIKTTPKQYPRKGGITKNPLR